MSGDFAMITAIADVYDAMTAARRYRAPLCPFAVISSFESEGFTKYNTKFLLLFLKKLATTYQSNRVMLNDSRFCNIVMLNPHELSRPIVRFDDGSILDLSTNREFFIKSVM
jgi:HD-GYP domain-containing protein (c-di-GMP phosphodiesterase class II)